MKSPITGKEMSLHTERRSMTFRKESFDIDFMFYKCDETGEEFTDEHLTDLYLTQLYNQYRERNNVPFPEEIVYTREKYGLSQAKMAEVLGIGVNNYRAYENGDIPSDSNSTLIKFAEDPYKFKDLVQMKSDLFSKNELAKTIKCIESEIQKKNSSQGWEALFREKAFHIEESNEMTGYRIPSIDKVENMILFFIDHCADLWTTKLNKLLFYGDFLHYKRTGFGITGTAYQAIAYGPVPYKYHNIYDHVQEKKNIEAVEEYIGDDASGYKFKKTHNGKFDPSLFSDSEVAALTDVVKLLGKKTVKEIVKISHEEECWKACYETKKIISYREFGVKLIIG